MTDPPALNIAFRGGMGPAVVLLPGIDSPSERWRPVAVALARENAVAVIELLGLGVSPRPVGATYGLDEHAAAVWCTVGAAFGDVPVRLVGHGLGGTVALACAAQRPELVSECIAFSPLLPPVDPARIEALRRESANSFVGMLGPERLVRRVLPRLRSLRAIDDEAIHAALERVSAPVLIVVPEGEPAIAREAAAAAVERLTSASLLVPLGHRDLPFDDPTAAAKLIEPGSETVLKAARREPPVDARPDGAVRNALRGPTALAMRRAAFSVVAVGTLTLLAGRSGSAGSVVAALLLFDALLLVAAVWGLWVEHDRWVEWLAAGALSGILGVGLTLGSALAPRALPPSVVAYAGAFYFAIAALQALARAVPAYRLGRRELAALRAEIANPHATHRS